MSLLKKIEEKRKKQRRAEKNKKVAIAGLGVAVGALAGSAAGVLFAPKSGKETREDIAEKSKVAKDKLNDGVQATKEKVEESKSKIKEYLEKKKLEKERSQAEELIGLEGRSSSLLSDEDDIEG